MEITEVKVILKEGPDKKLKAYATLTLDGCFVVRNVKVINGNKGLFVAMPSRKMRESCPKCNYKNAIRSRFCNQCGLSVPAHVAPDVNSEVRQSEHRDIAHPITLECREYIQKRVLQAYESELGKTGATQASLPKEEASFEKPKTESAKVPSAPVEEKKTEDDTGDIAL